MAIRTQRSTADSISTHSSSANASSNSQITRPCTHRSERKNKHCDCIDFIPALGSNKCSSCHHKQKAHVTLESPGSPSAQPGLTQIPATNLGTVAHIVATNASATTQSFIQKAQAEAIKGMTSKSKNVLTSTGMAMKETVTTASGSGKAKMRKDKPATSSPTGRFAGIIFNIHGLADEKVVVHGVFSPSTIDHYTRLGMAVNDPEIGILMRLDMNHEETVKFLTSLLPLLASLYPKKSSVDIEQPELAPWAVCTQHYNTISVSPIEFPTASDLWSKRTQPTKGFEKRYIYIASREAIPKDIVQTYCKIQSKRFDTIWNALGVHKKWGEQKGSDYSDSEGFEKIADSDVGEEMDIQEEMDFDEIVNDEDNSKKRKRNVAESDDSETDEEPLRKKARTASRTTKPRQSGRRTSERLASKNAKGKGKVIQVLELEPIADSSVYPSSDYGDVDDIADDLTRSSPSPPQPTKPYIEHPWRANRVIQF